MGSEELASPAPLCRKITMYRTQIHDKLETLYNKSRCSLREERHNQKSIWQANEKIYEHWIHTKFIKD
jgi:hypothetical protein